MNENTDAQQKDKQPTWLKTLENQSWQAEMVASGIIIYGSMELEPILVASMEYLIPLFNDVIHKQLDAIFMMLYFAQSLLVISFIGHLILRVVWTGFLGLSSVYPEGIDASFKKGSLYSEDFLQKSKEEFPDLSTYSMKLDRYCSLIFSISTAFVFIFLVMAIWYSIFSLLSLLIIKFFGLRVYEIVSIAFPILFILVAFFISYFASNYGKNTTIGKKYIYKINRQFSKVFLLFFYEPLGYIMGTIITNIKSKNLFVGYICIFLLAPFYSGFMQGTNPSGQSPEKFFRENRYAEEADSYNYLDQIGNHRILKPMIQSKEINSDYIKLFIPILKREDDFKTELCGEIKYDEQLGRRERRRYEIEQSTNCAQQYYKISIDSLPFLNPQFNYVLHENKNEKGFLVYLELDSLKRGTHELRLETGYKNEEGEKAVRVIPFYKTK